jgi:hypothetical protein
MGETFTIQKVLCHLPVWFELARIGTAQPENQPTLVRTMQDMYLYLFRDPKLQKAYHPMNPISQEPLSLNCF